jgi:hypothetical protein
MSLDVNTFKAKLTGAGARPNLFRVIINFPAFVQGDTELTSFMCKGASLPPAQIGAVMIPFRGRQLHVPGDRTYEPWEVTIINDTNFNVRDALMRWSNAMNSFEGNVTSVSPDAYYTDLIVEQLDRDNNVLKSYKIVGAWPVTVGQIDLNFESSDAIEQFTATFRYLYWV